MELDDAYTNGSGMAGDEPLVSDQIYDLIEMEVKSRGLGGQVGCKLRQGDDRVNLPYHLGSTDKITPKDELKLNTWLNEWSDTSSSVLVEPKLDGVSVLAVYDLTEPSIKLYTRGDGEVGGDISHLFQFLQLPAPQELKARCKKWLKIAVRGEIIVPRDVFKSKYAQSYRNARNMASGVIGSKTSRAGHADLRMIAYEIVEITIPSPISNGPPTIINTFTQGDALETLKKLGFATVDAQVLSLAGSAASVALQSKFIEDRTVLNYDIDGLIVHTMGPYTRSNSGNPDYLFAFKMLLEDDIREVRVIQVKWTQSKLGKLKPVVMIEPVDVCGVTISQVTGHNARNIVENSIGPNAVVKVTRSKDVIPYIVKTVAPGDSGLPDGEGTVWNWDVNRVDLVLVKTDGTVKEGCIKRLIAIFKELKMKHISDETVRKLYASGLDDFFKIITAPVSEIAKIPSLGQVSAQRIRDSITEGMRMIKLSAFLGACGVFGEGFGTKRVAQLLTAIPDLLTVYRTTPREEMYARISAIDGFGDSLVPKVVDNLKVADIIARKLRKYTVFEEEQLPTELDQLQTAFQDQTVVFSGFRNEDWKNAIIRMGGRVTDSVSRKTTLVVTPDPESATGKVQDARRLGIPIVSKSEFESRMA